MSQSKGYVDIDYLQVAARLAKHLKERTYMLMQIQAGLKVLDVGCGPGTDTIPLGHLVGATGQVVGIDFDREMLFEADRRAQKENLSQRVVHKYADATALPFDANSFDACRSERLFQHLLNPEQVLSEMVRVTKVGGWIVVMDSDWGTLAIDAGDIEIDWRLNRFRAEKDLNNGYSGRKLYRMFKRQCLSEIYIEPYATACTDYEIARQMGSLDAIGKKALSAKVVTEDELQQYFSSLEQASAEGVFFVSLSGIIAAGRKVSF